MTHNTEGLLGYIYCDFFERPGKLHNDSHYVVRGGRLLPDKSYQVNIQLIIIIIYKYIKVLWYKYTFY